MSEVVGLLEDICEHPEDDVPRLIFADWLEEHGDFKRAEFIRIGCALAQLPRTHPDWLRLFRRENELIAQNKQTWFGLVRQHCSYWEVRRGFVDEIVTSFRDFQQLVTSLYLLHPVQQVKIGGFSASHLAQFVALPELAYITHLNLSFSGIGDALEELADCPYLFRLQRLNLSSTRMDPLGAAALANSRTLSRVTALDVSGNPIGAVGALALLESPFWTLRELNLSEQSTRQYSTQSQEDAAGIEEIVQHPAFRHLRRLSLRNNNVGRRALRALLASPYLDHLEQLDLRANPLESDPECQYECQELRQRLGGRLQFNWMGHPQRLWSTGTRVNGMIEDS